MWSFLFPELKLSSHLNHLYDKICGKANSFNSFPSEAFAVCENYSPPEGFNPKDLHRLLEKVGSPSGGEDLGNVMFHMIAHLLCVVYWDALERNSPKLFFFFGLNYGVLVLMGPILSWFLLIHVAVMILCWLTDCSSGWLEGPNKVYIPFLACGDLSGYDSDRSYPLPKVADGTYKSLDPVQPPIAPPYKRALELKKASSHGIQELEKLSLDSWSWCITFI